MIKLEARDNRGYEGNIISKTRTIKFGPMYMTLINDIYIPQLHLITGANFKNGRFQLSWIFK